MLLDGEVVLAYCSMPGPENDFHLIYILKKVHLSASRTDVFIY